MEHADGLTLAIGGTAVGAICTLIGSWIKARYSKTTISPNPLRVSSTNFDKLIQANENEHKNLFDRMNRAATDIAGLKERTTGMDRRLERMEYKLDRIIEGQNHDRN